MSSGEVGTWLGLIAGIVGGVGTLVGGWAADRLGARDRRWYCWVCVVSLVVHARSSPPATWLAIRTWPSAST